MEQYNGQIGTRKDLVLYRIETAKSDLKSAKILLDGRAFKRHKDAIANFNKDYVKTEIFPREIGRKIGEAEEIRHASDYADFYIASKEESERQIKVAEEFIGFVEKYCTQQKNE